MTSFVLLMSQVICILILGWKNLSRQLCIVMTFRNSFSPRDLWKAKLFIAGKRVITSWTKLMKALTAEFENTINFTVSLRNHRWIGIRIIRSVDLSYFDRKFGVHKGLCQIYSAHFKTRRKRPPNFIWKWKESVMLTLMLFKRLRPPYSTSKSFDNLLDRANRCIQCEGDYFEGNQ